MPLMDNQSPFGGLMGRLQQPGMGDYLTMLGLSALAAGGQQPAGVNRAGIMLQGVGAASSAKNQAMQLAQMEEYRKAQMAQIEAAAQEKADTKLNQERFANSFTMGMNGPRAQPNVIAGTDNGGLTGQGQPGGFMKGYNGLTPEQIRLGIQAGQGGPILSQLMKPPPEAQKPMVVAPGSRVYDPVQGKEVYSAPEKPAPTYGEPQFDKGMNMWYQPGPNGKRDYVRPPTGMTFTSDGKGGISLTQGAGVGIGNPTKTELEKGIAGDAETLAAVQSMRSDYQKSFLTFKGKATAAWNSFKAKGGADLPPEDRKQLEDFSIFRASAGKTSAQIINQMSGAAVTESEAKRQEIYLPTAGTGLFDGDDPVEFESKLNRMESFTAASMWRKRNLIDSGMSLEQAAAKAPLYAENKETGKRVWLHEFVDAAQKANPGAAMNDIIALWSKNYAGR